jgi:predicted nucleotidyltransferase
MDSLRRLAHDLSIPERTLRRAAREGLLHGERLGPRRFRTTLREESYLRSRWQTLKALREALRTEPNVRFAVLFGSFATGSEHARSDIDLVVELADRSVGRLADLAGRLSSRVGRDVQPVRLSDAEDSPALMLDVTARGRVLVDREQVWPKLKAQTERWRKAAEREQDWRFEPMDDLSPS